MKKVNKQVDSFTQFGSALVVKMNNNRTLTILFLLAAFISAWIALDEHLTKKYFSNFLDAFAGIVTLLVAIGLALENYLKSWRASLPKTLTVHFTHDKQYYLSCYYADLTSEGDIRNWAQQLGQQMTNSALFDFNPFFDLEEPKVITLDPHDIKALHYEITIRLKSTQNVKTHREVFKNKEDQSIYKRWFVVHDPSHTDDNFIELTEIEPTTTPEEVTYDYAKKNKKEKVEEKKLPKSKSMTNEELAEKIIAAIRTKHND